VETVPFSVAWLVEMLARWLVPSTVTPAREHWLAFSLVRPQALQARVDIDTKIWGLDLRLKEKPFWQLAYESRSNQKPWERMIWPAFFVSRGLVEIRLLGAWQRRRVERPDFGKIHNHAMFERVSAVR
jgi:hypothetical protein